MVDMVEIILTYMIMVSEEVIAVRDLIRQWKSLVRFTNEADKKAIKKDYK